MFRVRPPLPPVILIMLLLKQLPSSFLRIQLLFLLLYWLGRFVHGFYNGLLKGALHYRNWVGWWLLDWTVGVVVLSGGRGVNEGGIALPMATRAPRLSLRWHCCFVLSGSNQRRRSN